MVQATDVLEILNLILKIMCEAWLDHIYGQKTKFRYALQFSHYSNFGFRDGNFKNGNRTDSSREGALNLLRDFDGVSEWIRTCRYVRPEHVEILAKHEVLRTCEGVGKILLRKPFEVISMIEETSFTSKGQHKSNGNFFIAIFS